MTLRYIFRRFAGRSAILLSAIIFFSCSSQRNGLFGKRSAHEKYASSLESAGLQATAMGKEWFAAASKSLAQPLKIDLPFKETGYFSEERPMAAGYRFNGKKGDKLSIIITTVPTDGALLFAELWQEGIETAKHKLLGTVDTLTGRLEFEVENERDFIVRLQPELLRGIEYTLIITTQPSLAFPVQSSGNPRIISLWGVDRDAGVRSHEGIDIGAKFRTPALAAADGRVSRVNENNLGGKVVFMIPKGRDYSLYYAHLDQQLVSPGQQVKEGDTLGLIGNTGNARTTPPHLHFGIYTTAGAIDPFPFVNPDRSAIPAIAVSLDILNQFVHNQSSTSFYPEPSNKSKAIQKLEPGTVFRLLSATSEWYKVQLPDGTEGFVAGNIIRNAPIRNSILKQEARLLNAPLVNAASKETISPGQPVTVLGKYKEYTYVQHGSRMGWINGQTN